jgi:DNA phosphorothioation-dependent restriction protein DptG
MRPPDGGVKQWKANTSPFERVLSVASSLSEPRKAAWIASEAAVAETTARTYLDHLVTADVVREHTDEEPPTYAPDPLYHRFQTIRDLVTEQDQDELQRLSDELQDQIETWKAEYDVESPEELREEATAEATSEQAGVRSTANDWQLVRYRLSVVQQALRNYEQYQREVTPLTWQS